MKNSWVNIWNRRQLAKTNVSVLESLLRANGYDSNFSKIEEADWIAYAFCQGEKLQISPNDSLFEVGCGAGAFLYPFYQRGSKVAGIDYSSLLVNLAMETMPQAEIEVKEAINISLEKEFDVVLSSSVFLYFPNYEYASRVLNKMLKIAKKSVGIFDVPDLAKQAEAIAMRKGKMGEVEYADKYQGLDHLYYSKDWFTQTLAIESVQVKIEDQDLPKYNNASYRFNVYIYKH